MKRWLIALFFLVLIIVVSIKYGFFLVGGISYKLIESKFPQLDARVQKTVNYHFYAQGQESHIYVGTVAKVSQQGDGGVWVWSNEGLKYFQADEHTVYSYYDVCQAYRNNPQQMRVNDEVRTVTNDIGIWSELVSAGNFVQIMTTTTSHGGTEGNLREALVYSQPLFLPMNLKAICE